MGDAQKKRGNYLSIDGGASGLPALYIIDEMGSRMQFDLKSEEEMLLWRHFDLIMGTGPGGLVSILIGRLRFTTSKAIEAYLKLMPVLTLGIAKDDEERKRNTERFKVVFQEVLKDAGLQPDSPMLDNDGTKVVVCASEPADLSLVHLIRSYRVRSARTPVYTILEAACTCIASPDAFFPITLGTGHKQVTLIDAHAACANPAKELLREAQRIFGDDAEVATILSIGSGKGGVWNISEMKEALKGATSSCELVHEELHARLRKASIYFRLNVDKGTKPQLELSPSQISAYLQEGEINDKLDGALESIERRPNGIMLKDINSVTVIDIALKPRPSLVRKFVGRQDILNSLRCTHLTNHHTDLTSPAITVLSGLGGSGKTQTALKFALEFEALCPNAPVYFLNASTEESLKVDYETLIRSLGSENRSKSYEDALRLLAEKIKDWLIILDNADNPRLNLFPYLPKCTHGNIIITTRNSNHAMLAPESSHHLEGLSTDDAIELILTASSNENYTANRDMARQIVQEFGHLPLALAQAAGYIFVHKCLPIYLELYRHNTRKLLAAVPLHLPSDYPSSVAATIQMSLNQLPAKTQGALRVFSHLDSTSIAHEIISKAAERNFRRVEKTEESELNSQTIQQAEVLMEIFCDCGEWSEVNFNDLINQCLQYSLLRLTIQGDSKFYSMHILVQAYLRAILDPVQGRQPGPLAIRLLGSSITYSTIYEYLAFNRLIVPHLRLIKMEDIIEGGDHFGFGHVFENTGYGRLSVPHIERCVELWRVLFGDRNKNTLVAMRDLATSYKAAGSTLKALEIEERVLVVMMMVLGPESPVTLTVMKNLAASYSAVGRYQEALDVDEKVLESQKKILGPEDPNTLRAMANLAVSYHDVGRTQEALKLNETVLELQKRLVDPDSPDTLITMVNIAELYNAVGRHQEALDLNEDVLGRRKRILGKKHPRTLLTMNYIVTSYSNLGRHQEALDLCEVVLDMQTRELGVEHPDTLVTTQNLLLEFQHLGLIERLVDSLRVALPLHEKALGMDHPNTIKLKKRFEHYLDPIQVGAQPAVSISTSSPVLRSIAKKRNNPTPEQVSFISSLGSSLDQVLMLVLRQAPPAKRRKTSNDYK